MTLLLQILAVIAVIYDFTVAAGIVVFLIRYALRERRQYYDE